MVEILNQYREAIVKAEEFRQLSEIERKVIVQRFINQIIYDAEKFRVAVRVLEKWEKNIS